MYVILKTLIVLLPLVVIIKIVKTTEKYRGKIAYSKYLDSYIKATLVINKRCWYFVRCDNQGIDVSFNRVIRAGSPINIFKWENIKRGDITHD